MPNRIKQIFSERNINVAKFARDNSITPTTLYGILDRNDNNLGGVSVDLWIKISEGLGINPEELYFGELDDDITKAEIIEIYESMPVDGKRAILVAARSAKEIYSEQREKDLESD